MLWLALMTLALAGCALQKIAPSSPDAPGGLAAHTLSGRLSVRYPDPRTGHDESAFAHFDWSDAGGRIRVQLLDPLGQSLALIESDPHQSILTLRDGQRFTGDSPEELTQAALGWRLPLSGLADWLDGRAAHGGVIRRDADGVGHLEEDGWRISFTASDASPADHAAPRRLDLSYTGPGTPLEIRIIIDERSPA